MDTEKSPQYNGGDLKVAALKNASKFYTDNEDP